MQAIETAVRDAQQQGQLPCALAHQLARENAWSPAQVGAEADQQGVKITLCQLGLFGYRAFGHKGPVQCFASVPEELAAALRKLAPEGKAPCRALWKLADQRGVPRVAMGCAAETLELKVSPCQLGCF